MIGLRRSWMLLFVAVIGALLVLAAACGDDDGDEDGEETPPADETMAPEETEEPAAGALDITGVEYSYSMPASIAGGVTAVNFSNIGAEDHQATFVQLNEGVTFEDFSAALLALDPEAGASEADLLEFGAFLGGPGSGPGGEGSNVIDLAAGQYAVLCLIPNAEGTPHFALGMVAGLEVTEPAAEQQEPPTADVSVGLSDFQFDAPDSLPAGETVFEVSNNGPQIHEMAIAQPGEGLTSQQMVDILTTPPDPEAPPPEGPPPFTFIGQVSLLNNGEAGIATMDLEPGTYTYICFVIDPDTGAPHAALGMWKEFTVE